MHHWIEITHAAGMARCLGREAMAARPHAEENHVMSKHEDFAVAERQLFMRYQLPIDSRFIQLADPQLRLRLLCCGDGPPALFVHGGGALAAEWTPLLATLRGIRMFAIDRPGCGLSDGFDYRHVDLRQHAVAVLSATLDALGLASAPIVGCSMGGLWALWLALDHPERVAALALLGSPALFLTTRIPFGMRLLAIPGLNRLVMALERPSHRQYLRFMSRVGERQALAGMPAEQEAMFLAAERLPTYRQGWLSLLECALQLGGSGIKPAWHLGADELRRVRQPTTFVWGGRDPFGGPEVGRAACAIMPAATLAELPHAGHLPWFDDPERCAAAVRDIVTAA
jgi:pimeloyl-ACP methyl ester carboxylesterase